MTFNEELERHWAHLPEKLCMRWQLETRWGEQEPSEDLKRELEEAIEAVKI